jgi:hypothetical protein
VVKINGSEVYATPRAEYEVRFVEEDGSSVIEEGRYYYNESVVVPADPIKAATAEYTYTFSGWDDGENEYGSGTLPVVTKDVTYRATYKESKNSYTVTIVSSDVNS